MTWWRKFGLGKKALVSTMAFLAHGGAEQRASACSLAAPYEDYDIEESDDTTPPTLDAANIRVKRARDPGGESADCSDIGSYRVVVEASDDETRASDLGYSLELVSGTLPFTLPDGVVENTFDGEALEVWFTDDGGSFDGTIQIRVVDRAGNESEPIERRVRDDAVGCGCSVPGRASGGGSCLGLVLALAVARRRRAQRA